MNEGKRINSYFDGVKQNPPLFNMDKVNQLLSEPKAKAKVEKGRRNLIRFTIMTTLFAIIISAFLLWPDAREETLDLNHVTTQKQISDNSVQLNNSKPTVIDKEVDSVENNSVIEPNKKITVSTKFIENDAEKVDSVYGKTIQFNAHNFAYYNSSKNNDTDFGIILNRRESFDLENKDSTIWLSIISPGIKKLVSGEYCFSESASNMYYPMTFNGQYFIHADSAIKIVGGKVSVDTSRTNYSIVYEFILEDNHRISGKYVSTPISETEKTVPVVEEPKREYVYPEQILDSTLFIELSKQQFQDLGFVMDNVAMAT